MLDIWRWWIACYSNAYINDCACKHNRLKSAPDLACSRTLKFRCPSADFDRSDTVLHRSLQDQGHQSLLLIHQPQLRAECQLLRLQGAAMPGREPKNTVRYQKDQEGRRDNYSLLGVHKCE